MNMIATAPKGRHILLGMRKARTRALQSQALSLLNSPADALDPNSARDYKAIMKFILAILIGFSFTTSLAHADPPTADQVLAPAKVKAADGHKAIFLHFGASWCIWCNRLDAFLDRPEIKSAFEKYFVPVKLVVQENAKNKALENPGADALLKQLGGPSGLPYSAFLDAKGTLIVNSKLNGQNIGYPGQPDEIDWFIRMMKQAAPSMSQDDLKTIETALRNPKKT
jgi:hypothetical protein